ncbi:sensor histidine kinase [Paractinoplanes rishiriensis]|nr:ATP-binding protein [Actinoplanes rishiriensis]
MGVRLRYTLLYGAMFLICSAGLLVLVAAFGLRNTTRATPYGQPPTREEVGRMLAEQDEIRNRQLLAGVTLALLVMLVLAVLVGRLLAGRVLRPLRVITAATRRISADNLHERLAVTGPADEVKALADTIDDLLGRLEESFAAQRRFVADASHELRTPLATMRASLDVALAKPGPIPPETDRLAGRLRTELDQVDRLLEGFLLLARAQHGALDDRTEVSLADLALAAVTDKPAETETGALTDKSEMFGRRRTIADTRAAAVKIHADLTPGDAVVRGNPVLLARMVGNLVDNAFRHNVPGGRIRVTVRATTLTVESTGPLLDPAQVARLGRPFQRLGPDRTGESTGLGLSIVAAIAEAHGGTLDLAARDGGGLIATVQVPR